MRARPDLSMWGVGSASQPLPVAVVPPPAMAAVACPAVAAPPVSGTMVPVAVVASSLGCRPCIRATGCVLLHAKDRGTGAERATMINISSPMCFVSILFTHTSKKLRKEVEDFAMHWPSYHCHTGSPPILLINVFLEPIPQTFHIFAFDTNPYVLLQILLYTYLFYTKLPGLDELGALLVWLLLLLPMCVLNLAGTHKLKELADKRKHQKQA